MATAHIARLPGTLFLRNLVERRSLLFQLVRRDFEQRFVGSAAGWVWVLVQPLVLLLSWTFVFQWCLGMTLPETEVTQNYTMFLFCGYLPWLLFQETVTRSAGSLLENRNLITKTVFPAELIPVSIFLSSLISHFMTLGLGLAAAIFWVKHFSMMVFLLPFYMFLLGLFAVGVGWIFASLQVYLRDTAQVLMVILTFWFWITPIFINESQYPESLRFVIHANPLALVVRAYRNRLLSGIPPTFEEFAALACYAVPVFIAGGLFFRHLKRGFPDVL